MKRFPDHARVLFIGDSITCNGTWIAHIYDYYLRNFPDADIRMYNSGISGGSCGSALKYYDVGNGDNYQPTHAVIMLGMNDVGRHLYEIGPEEEDIADRRLDERKEHIDRYERLLKELAHRLLAKNVKLTFIAGTGYDETTLPRKLDKIGCDAALEYLGEINRRLAVETGSDFINFHAPMRFMNSARILINPDRVHPDGWGHVYMAQLFLAAQGLVDEPTVLTIVDLPDPEALLPENKQRFKAENKVRTLWNVEWLILQNVEGGKAEKEAYLREYRKNTPGPYFDGLVDRYFELEGDMARWQQEEWEACEACVRK